MCKCLCECLCESGHVMLVKQALLGSLPPPTPIPPVILHRINIRDYTRARRLNSQAFLLREHVEDSSTSLVTLELHEMGPGFTVK